MYIFRHCCLAIEAEAAAVKGLYLSLLHVVAVWRIKFFMGPIGEERNFE